ncbi:hypothetical protein G3A43_42790 [Paraburkholderia aspalathi]|uniref:hypothetical protein n=1 Tax=Paraburkholderia nemoris TaxID=2793076 RepID=UPI00190A2A4F|nr:MULTISPECIES: hypothetical protein [Paraburkholderia]MBK3786901.1 hypothetical protein [Paraburkholderia aspalathi]
MGKATRSAARAEDMEELEGSEKIGISVQRRLLREIDAEVERRGVTRSAFFCFAASMLMDGLLKPGADATRRRSTHGTND